LTPEIAFFVSGFEDAPVLHHDADPSRIVERAQKGDERGGKNLGIPNFAPELAENPFQIDLFSMPDLITAEHKLPCLFTVK
jgi:hypothetical protein